MTFLISRTDKIGDVVISLSVANFIKKIEPKSKVFFLVRNGLSPIVSRAKNVDGFFEVITNGQRGDIKISEIKKLSAFLQRNKPEVCFMLYPKPILALIMKINKVKICGTSRRFFSFLFDYKVDISRRQNLFHESYYNLQVLSPFFKEVEEINFQLIVKDFRPEVKIEEELIKFVRNKFSLPNEYVVFHPFSGGSSPPIDLDYLSEVARYIDLPVVWVGLGNISPLRDLKAISLINRTLLDELMAVLKMGKVVLSSSSGPIHIASALGVPTIGFYKKRDVVRWMPINPVQEIFYLEEMPDPKSCAQTVIQLSNLTNKE